MIERRDSGHACKQGRRHLSIQPATAARARRSKHTDSDIRTDSRRSKVNTESRSQWERAAPRKRIADQDSAERVVVGKASADKTVGRPHGPHECVLSRGTRPALTPGVAVQDDRAGAIPEWPPVSRSPGPQSRASCSGEWSIPERESAGRYQADCSAPWQSLGDLPEPRRSSHLRRHLRATRRRWSMPHLQFSPSIAWIRGYTTHCAIVFLHPSPRNPSTMR